MSDNQPRRPDTRRGFGIAIICALPLEADAVIALFDHYWDETDPPYNKVEGDPNAYTAGALGCHNVVVAHMPGMGNVNAATVASNCRVSFPSIKIAIVVGICGIVPFNSAGGEMILGDVIISSGVVQYDLGRQLPDRFVRKDTLLDSLGRPNAEIRSLLAKLNTHRERRKLREKASEYMEVLRSDPDLQARYPGTENDILFEAAFCHVSDGPCDRSQCTGPLVHRRRLEEANPQQLIHFGLVASGSGVMKSGEHRDEIAKREDIVAFEMEGAGVWDTFPSVMVIKGACDYADSHKTKSWQPYAAAMAASATKAFLTYFAPSIPGIVIAARSI